MSIELDVKERALRDEVERLNNEIKKALAQYRIDENVQKQMKEMGKNAHELHMALKADGNEPRHHEYMIKNRGVEPDDPIFYMHVHPVEDLLKYINDPHANDDQKDQTIGQEFKFLIYSRRWGHDDTYTIKRTEEGWDILPNSIGGPCDKGGHPFLFKILHQDLVQYPYGLGGWLEWLWEQAASKGLSKEEVQNALQELSNWVSNTERNAPSGGVWKGY